MRLLSCSTLVPLGFAEGQLGASAQQAQVIFCSDDGGCTDLVIDLEASPAWRIIDVRYWGFPAFPHDSDSDINIQLAALARTLPVDLS